MNAPLVHDLLLLTAHPTRGTVRRPTGPALPRALAGAAIDDLLAGGAARLDGERLVLAAVPPDPLLQHVSARLSGRYVTVDEGIESLAAPRTRLGQHVVQALTVDGAVRPCRRRLWGVLPVTSAEVTASEEVERLRRRVANALSGSLDDPRATALAGLVAAGDIYRPVHISTGAVLRRDLRLLIAQDPVAGAVARTVRRARRDAATTAAVAATAGAAAASGS